MRLRHLEIFHAVMRTGSVSGAAELLNLTQSAASKALAQAEHAFGLVLFKRVGGRLVHTREAEQLFAQTTVLFTQVESVERLTRKLKRNPEDHLRIGCLPSLGLGLLPSIVGAFRARYPGVSLEVVTGNGDDLVENIVSREIDISICFDMPAPPALEKLLLGDIPIVHLARPRGGEAADTGVSLAQLDPAQWIGIGGSDPLAQRIRDAWPGLQESVRGPMLETRSYYVAAAFAREGTGFAIVDQFTAQAIASDMEVRPIAPALSIPAVALHIASEVRSLAFNGFLECLRARF
ncbi:MAG: LysR family transcriptional regulator [Comamonas sp.]